MTIALLAAVLVPAVLSAQVPAPSVQGPWLGEWKLNVEKSRFQAGAPPAGTNRTYSMQAAGPDSFDIVITSFTPAGEQTMKMELRGGRFDGKKYPEIGNPIADANRFRITGERSYEFVESKNDVDVMTITVEISPDGNARTSRQQTMSRDGKLSVNVAVWDRQAKR